MFDLKIPDIILNKEIRWYPRGGEKRASWQTGPGLRSIEELQAGMVPAVRFSDNNLSGSSSKGAP